MPETLINKAPVYYLEHTLKSWAGPRDLSPFSAEALAHFRALMSDPARVHAMCEDYRAAATVDLEHDRASRTAGVKIQCPLLVLWGSKGRIGKWYDPLAIWRQYCSAEVTGAPVNSGHYLAEEAPAEVLEHFGRFFG